jgi:hypothetical protein
VPQAGGGDAPVEAVVPPQGAPVIPPHLLGPNVGVVAPFVALPPNPGAAEEANPNIIELD